MATGDPTARFARELGISRQQLHTVRQHVQAHLHATAPIDVMPGTAFEADALYPHAGEKQHAPSRSQRSATSTSPYTQRPPHVLQR